MGRVFSEYGTPLTTVPFFKYLGRILSSSDNNWPAVEQNLLRARVKWALMVNILGREGADSSTAGIFYVEVMQAVVQVVLFLGQRYG